MTIELYSAGRQNWNARWAPVTYLLLSGVFFVTFLVSPFYENRFTVCLFKNIFGIPCPGCGMMRAILFLTHGDIAGAVRLNPNSVLFFLLAASIWINKAMHVFIAKEIRLCLNQREQIVFYILAGFFMFAAWIYNLTLNPYV